MSLDGDFPAPTGRSPVDLLLVSLGSTRGLQAADLELAGSLRRAGSRIAVVRAAPPPRVRTLALTDLLWALAARRAAIAGIAAHSPRAIIYSSVTAALLWPRPGAIRFDALAAANRTGRHGPWQRPLERRRLAQAALLLPYVEQALQEAPAAALDPRRTLVLPMPVDPSGAPVGLSDSASRASGSPSRLSDSAHDPSHAVADSSDAAVDLCTPPGKRDIAAITYAANPRKKGLDRVLAAWIGARREGERLLIAGVSAEQLTRAGIALPDGAGVQLTGMLDATRYRALLRRARVYICAPRREDFGTAQLEALADGCMLVSTPAPGPYAALPIARRLDPRLVGEDLGVALRCALDQPRPDYGARARTELAPFAREAVDRLVAQRLLPMLLR